LLPSPVRSAGSVLTQRTMRSVAGRGGPVRCGALLSAISIACSQRCGAIPKPAKQNLGQRESIVLSVARGPALFVLIGVGIGSAARIGPRKVAEGSATFFRHVREVIWFSSRRPKQPLKLSLHDSPFETCHLRRRSSRLRSLLSHIELVLHAREGSLPNSCISQAFMKLNELILLALEHRFRGLARAASLSPVLSL
jgi:hypothetical protein